MPKPLDINKLWSLEAEAAVLGSMLIDPVCVPKVLPRLPRSEAFFDMSHRLIYDALVALYVESKPIDAVSLRTKLREQGKFEEAGGVEYLAKILDAVPNSANVIYYAGVIRAKQKERDVIAAIREIDEIPDQIGTVDEKIEQLQNLALSIEPLESSADYIEAKAEVAAVAAEMQSGEPAIGLVPTGYKDLDRMIGGFRPGELIILAARPSMGKSALALDFALNAARQEQPALFFSLEMTPKSLIQRACCNIGSVDFRRVLARELTEHERENLREATIELQKLDLLISGTGNNPEQIAGLTHRLIGTHGVEILFVDYVQLMALNKRNESRQQEITAISRMLKQLAVRHDIPIVALSQLNRACEQREDHRPRLSDLRESGSIEQDADLVLFLFRDDYYKKDEPGFEPSGLAEVIISKNRRGPVGKRLLGFVHDYTRFHNLPDSYFRGQEYQDE